MELTDLKTQVEANTSAEQSAITLLNGLAAKIESLKNDPEAIQGLADELKGSGDALAAAVVANSGEAQ